MIASRRDGPSASSEATRAAGSSSESTDAGAATAPATTTFGPDRAAALCRELTKTHEEVRRQPLGELAGWASSTEVRGEITRRHRDEGQDQADELHSTDQLHRPGPD